jgi:hypothetical protein
VIPDPYTRVEVDGTQSFFLILFDITNPRFRLNLDFQQTTIETRPQQLVGNPLSLEGLDLFLGLIQASLTSVRSIGQISHKLEVTFMLSR